MPAPDGIDGRNDQFDRGSHDGSDRDLAAVSRLEGRQFRSGHCQFGKDDAGVADHQLAIPIRLDSSGVPIEPRKSQRVFKVAKQLRHGGLRKVEAGGGAVKVPVLVQGHEKLKMPELQAAAEKPVRRQGLKWHSNFRQ